MPEELPRPDEVLQKEQFDKPTRGIKGLKDDLVLWVYDRIEGIKPPKKSFYSRENRFAETSENGEQVEETIAESDLPVIQEALTKLQASRESGRLLNKEHNPMGDNLRELNLKVFGDIHIRGSELDETVPVMNSKARIQRILERLEKIPGTDGLKKRLHEMNQKMDEDGAEIASSIFEGFLAFKNTLSRNIKETQPKEKNPESATLLVNVGDNGFNEAKTADLALTALTLEEMREELEGEEPLYAMHSSGNHDSDLNNYALEHDVFHHELFGNQIFSQEVGTDVVVLSLDTNLYSSFWRTHLERRKKLLADQLQQLSEARKNGDEPELQALEQEWKEYGSRQYEALQVIRRKMAVQKQIIEEATNSGRQIVLIGHQEEHLIQAVGGDLAETKVIALVAGHVHIHKNKVIAKNKDGQDVRLLRVGASSFGLKKDEYPLTGFDIKISSNEGKTALEAKDLYPEKQDFDLAMAHTEGGVMV